MALGLFLFVVKPYNGFKARLAARRAAGEEEPEPEPEDTALLREIRDTLRQRS